MANEITSSVGSELYTNILQEAMFTAQEASVARNLVRMFDIQAGQGLTVQVPIYPTVAAASVAEATDLANTALNPSSVTITASEFGVMTTVTDLMRESAAVDIAADVGRILGQAMGEKLDTDVFALFSSLSANVGDGNDAEELDVDLIFKAVATLRTENAPGPYFAVVHPKAAYNLKKQITEAGGATVNSLSDLGNQAMVDGFVGRVAGVTIVESTLVPTVSSDGVVNAVFSQDAFGMALKRDFRLEEERDASLRASEYVMSGAKGQAILKNNYGVSIITDASL